MRAMTCTMFPKISTEIEENEDVGKIHSLISKE